MLILDIAIGIVLGFVLLALLPLILRVIGITILVLILGLLIWGFLQAPVDCVEAIAALALFIGPLLVIRWLMFRYPDFSFRGSQKPLR